MIQMSSSDEDDVPIRRNVRRVMRRRREMFNRYFSFVDPQTGISRGRYTGKGPQQAASKCFTKYVQVQMHSLRPPVQRNFRLYMREVTRGSPHKIYAYECTRIVLQQPQEIRIRDVQSGAERLIVHRHKNRVNRVRTPDDIRTRLEPAYRERRGLPKLPLSPTIDLSEEVVSQISNLVINSNITFGSTDSNIIEI
jgi:hypothetical protein